MLPFDSQMSGKNVAQSILTGLAVAWAISSWVLCSSGELIVS